MHDERLTLATICGGAVQEKMDRALERVAKNILDPNTDPAKKRSITLKISLKPDQNDTEDVQVDADISVTLAPEIGVSTRFFVNKDLKNGGVTVMEHKKGEIKGQLDFSDLGMLDSQEEDNIVRNVDEETGEIQETEQVSKVVDLRRKTM